MSFAKHRPVQLRTNLSDSKVTLAMKEGKVFSPLIDFDFCGPAKARQGFKPMLRENAFDAGEMALMTFLQAKAYGKPFVLLPVTISGRFQHYTIGYNSKLGDIAPKDIEGKRVGLRTYSQTTSVWVKGILQHEYGVDLDKISWLTVADSHLLEHKDPPNCIRLTPDASLDQMLLNGEIAAAILGDSLPNEPWITPLIPDPAAAAQAWYQREGVVPINHMFVVRQDLASARPDVISDLYRLFVESRAMAPNSAAAKLPPLGMEANRKAIEMAIEWSFEQKVIPRRMTIDELFDETSGGLN